MSTAAGRCAASAASWAGTSVLLSALRCERALQSLRSHAHPPVRSLPRACQSGAAAGFWTIEKETFLEVEVKKVRCRPATGPQCLLHCCLKQRAFSPTP